jgi:hypothetical protein
MDDKSTIAFNPLASSEKKKIIFSLDQFINLAEQKPVSRDEIQNLNYLPFQKGGKSKR